MGIALSSEPKTLDSTKRKDAKKPSLKGWKSSFIAVKKPDVNNYSALYLFVV